MVVLWLVIYICNNTFALFLTFFLSHSVRDPQTPQSGNTYVVKIGRVSIRTAPSVLLNIVER